MSLHTAPVKLPSSFGVFGNCDIMSGIMSDTPCKK